MRPRHDRATTPPPIPARLWQIAAVTGAGALMAMLDSTVVNLAIESLRVDLASSLDVVQWVASGYLIAMAVSLPTVGWLGSRLGYGRLWAVSLAAFVATSALCALAPGPTSLIVARVLQGLAAGLLVPAGQAVIGASAGRDQLGRIFGVLGLVIALGPAIGPAIGGLLLEVTSWRALFWLNVPVGAAALLAARGLVPSGSTSADRPLDERGLALLGLGLPALLYGATELSTGGPSALTLAAVGGGTLLVTGFALSSARAASPLVDVGLLRQPMFASATTTAGLTGANLYGGLLLLPLYLQLAAAHDVATTGLMLLALGLGTAVALPVAGTLTDRHGAGSVSLAGAVILVVTTAPFLLRGTLSAATLVGLLVFRGVGLAWAQMPAVTAAYAAAGAERAGDAATLVNIVQRVGGALGAIGLAIVIGETGGDGASGSGGSGDGAYRGAFVALFIISLLTIASAAMLRRRTGAGGGAA